MEKVKYELLLLSNRITRLVKASFWLTAAALLGRIPKPKQWEKLELLVLSIVEAE